MAGRDIRTLYLDEMLHAFSHRLHFGVEEITLSLKVKVRLQIEPESRGVAEEACKPKSCIISQTASR